MSHSVTPSFTQDRSYSRTLRYVFLGIEPTTLDHNLIYGTLALACLLSAPVGCQFRFMLNLCTVLVLPTKQTHPAGKWLRQCVTGCFMQLVSRGLARRSSRVWDLYWQFLRKCVNFCVNIWITFALLDMGGRFPTLSCSIWLAGSAAESPILRTQEAGSCLESLSSFRAPPFPRTRFPPLPGGRGCLPR